MFLFGSVFYVAFAIIFLSILAIAITNIVSAIRGSHGCKGSNNFSQMHDMHMQMHNQAHQMHMDMHNQAVHMHTEAHNNACASFNNGMFM